METVFRYFASRPILSSLLLGMAALLGFYAIANTQRTLLPNVELNEIWVTTHYPGAAPEDVELNVTNKIEKQLANVSSIRQITSRSMENISSIRLIIAEERASIDDSLNEVREAVGRISDFPPEVPHTPVVAKLSTAAVPIIEVAVVGDLPYSQLRPVAKRIEQELRDIPGVGRITPHGLLAKEVQIGLSPKLLDRYQISMAEVAAAIRRRNIRMSGGTFESYAAQKNLITLSQFQDPAQVEDVIVRSTFDGPKIRVRDLAVVHQGYERPHELTRLNGQPAISLHIQKSESGDILRTVDRIHALLAKERTNVPDGIQLQTAADLSRYVRTRFEVVKSNGIMGLLLVVAILTVFLSLQTAFWVAIGIPFCLFGVLALLLFMDYELDAISLAGFVIVLGIIVDDSIIVSESIYRRFELGDPPLDAAVNGLSEVFLPVVTTICTTFLAFAPMFMLPGIMGRFTFVIPLVVTLALAFSLVEFVACLPAHLVPVMRRLQRTYVRKSQTKANWFDGFRSKAQSVIRFSIRIRYVVVLLAVVVLAGTAGYAHKYMNFILMEDRVADEFHIMMAMPPGSSLRASADKIREIENVVAQRPKGEVDSYISRIGQWGIDYHMMVEGERYATVQVVLTPYNERPTSVDVIVAELRKQTEEIEGAEDIQFYIKAGGPPLGPPLSLTVVAADNTIRRQLTDRLAAFLNNHSGVTDVDRDDPPGKDQIELIPDYDKLAQLGLTAADIAENVRIAYDGQIVANIRYGDEDVNFRVSLERQAKQGIKHLRELMVPNQQGRLIKLGTVADVRTGPGPAAIRHHDHRRSTTLNVGVDKTITTPLEVSTAIESNFNLARDFPGARIVVGGEAQETAESLTDLTWVLAIALIAIYFLLILLFDSVVQPMLVMLSIPFGAGAVITAFALHDEPLGFLAALGLVGLSGVVVNDSLVLVNRINELRKMDAVSSVSDIVAQGSSDRLRAVLMTTITTVAGLLPLAYGWGGSDPFMAPMALAIGYGLLLVTPVTLVLLPCCYVIGLDIQSVLTKLKPSRP